MIKAKERVFVTGMSAVTASGATADETWQSLITGESGIAEIQREDISSWPHRLGGEIKSYQPATMLPDRKLIKMISRQDVLGIHAVMQAVTHSQLMSYSDSLMEGSEALSAFQHEVGVFVGSPGNKYSQQYDFLPLIAKAKGDMKVFAEHLFSEVHPMWLLRILPNNVLAYAGITYGFKGANHNITNHAVSGMQAIIEAYHAIQAGQISRAVVVAYDIALEPQTLYYFQKLGLLAETSLSPFDVSHHGTLLAEGASAMILESESAVRERQATCYAEVLGGSAGTEAEGLFSVEAEGHELARLMSQSLNQIGLYPSDIHLVIAHGNGNPKSDISEALAIDAVFPHHDVPVTGFKWSTGHTLSAAGMIDTVLGIYALQHQRIPGIAPLTRLAPTCERLNAHQESRSFNRQAEHALVINRGFGSMNACVLIRACDGDGR